MTARKKASARVARAAKPKTTMPAESGASDAVLLVARDPAAETPLLLSGDARALRSEVEGQAPASKKPSRAKAAPKPPAPEGPPYGFGFDPAEGEHHFVVTLPASGREPVYVSEQFVWHEHPERRHLSLALGNEESKMRVVLPQEKWELIAEAAAAEFNQRLRRKGVRAGAWKPGYVAVSRLFGKELVLLAWSIEDADPALVPAAVRNWKGLTPEERWWLFTMTNAATGHAVTGRNLGWRKAIRYALTENPVSESVSFVTPAPFRLEAAEGPVAKDETPKKKKAARKTK